MKKRFLSLISAVLCAVLILSLAGCKGSDEIVVSSAPVTENYVGITVTVGSVKGEPSIPLAPLMRDAEENKTQNRYIFSSYSSVDDLVAAYNNGDIDVAMLPLITAAEIYNSSFEINMIAVSLSGGYWLVENGDTVNDFEELRGKTLGIVGQNSEGDYVWRFMMHLNAVDTEDNIDIRYFETEQELSSALVSGDVQVALMDGGAAARVIVGNPDIGLNRCINLNDEWLKARENELPSYCCITDSDFTSRTAGIVKKVVAELEESAKYAASERKKTAKLCEKYGIMDAAVAEEILKSYSPNVLSGKYMKQASIGYYSMRLSFDRTLMNGRQPDEKFYFN